MTTGIWITLIICGSLVLMSIISAVGKAQERKHVNDQINNFNKAFKNFDEKNQDNDFFKKF
ncbi:MAG: hypothetical protein IKT42_06965 [Clostridia bacterium]|nr:hypothetical protein [Clostridia bacterium]